MKTKLDEELIRAINRYDTEKVLEYIALGADVNIKGQHEITALHIAAIRGNSAAAENILNKGALIDALDQNKSTPLLYAFKAGEAVVASILIKNGADLDLENNEGISARKISQSHGCSSRLLDAIAGKEVLSFQEMVIRQRKASAQQSKS